MSQLPEGWVNCKLGDVVDYGQTVKADMTKIDESTWVLELEDLEKDSSKILQRVSFGDRKPKSAKNSFEAGDVLYGKLRPYLNKIVVAPEEGICTSEIIPLKVPIDILNNRFLFYWLKFRVFGDYVNAVSYGVNMPRLGTKDGLNAPMVLAPTSEQTRIVAKMDEILEKVESTQARLARIPHIIKQFRQSVLAAAASGKLSEEWRGDSSYSEMDLNLEKTDKSFYMPTAWTKIRLSDACQVISGHAFKSQNFLNEGKVPAIKISNIQYGQFEVKNQQFLPSEYLNIYKKFVVIDGDLLMALTRPITNDTLKVCRYPSEQPTGLLNQRVAKFIFKNENEKALFELLFQSDYFKVQVLDKLSETLQPNLSPVDLKKFIIATPNELEQTEIVRRVEQLFAYADVIEQQAKTAKERVDNLTQAILAKAFRGELTADWRAANPDLISGDNSAAALLARIQAERATASGKKGKCGTSKTRTTD